MLPLFYQTCFQANLSESQYLTLQLLILLLQAHRNVCLSRLASLFPQPIKYESRLRNLKRFLKLPRLSVKLLCFPLIKNIVKQQFRANGSNRAQRRQHQKLHLIHRGYLLLIIDRSQWRERNLIMLSLVWGQHALPVYWQCLAKKGNSNLAQQKSLFAPVLKLLNPYPVVVLGDREFHTAWNGSCL
jgi:hypothetical protein